MTPPLYIAIRFLSHRKRAFILSLSGVVFGVAIFICTQAQTQGFAKNFIDSTLGSNGALVLRSRFQTGATGLMVPPKSSARNAAGLPRRHRAGQNPYADQEHVFEPEHANAFEQVLVAGLALVEG